jgi:hypothetical protein
LINSKTNIDNIGANGLTALMLAIEYSRTEDIINKLIESGANINIKIPFGNNTYLQKLYSMKYEWHHVSHISKQPIDKLIEIVKKYNGGMYLYMKNLKNLNYLNNIEIQELTKTGDLFLNTQHSILKTGEFYMSKNRKLKVSH